MRRVIVQEWMALDGVVQAPGAADEDTTGGFEHGGWHLRYFDDISMKWVVENLAAAGGFLLGRRTYEGFASHWPNASEEEQVIAQPLNTGSRSSLPPERRRRSWRRSSRVRKETARWAWSSSAADPPSSASGR